MHSNERNRKCNVYTKNNYKEVLILINAIKLALIIMAEHNTDGNISNLCVLKAE